MTATSETPPSVPVQAGGPEVGPGHAGERLTRDEAFDLLRRAVASLARNDDSVRASDVRDRARDLLGRDSESLSERNFIRILKDAHDADVVDLRRRGDDFEVARAESAPSVSDQLAKAQPAAAPRSADAGLPARLSLRGRGSGGRARPSSLPPELLSVGIVAMPSDVGSENGAEEPPPDSAKKRSPRKRGRVSAATPEVAEATSAPRGAKRPTRARVKKAASKSDDA